MSNNGKAFLTAADIFSTPLKTEIVEAFGGKLMVQELMEGHASKVAETQGDNTARGMRLLIACVVDPETRNPLFTENDVVELKRVSNAEMLKVVKAVNRVNGWAPVEDVAKNSEASPNADSVTA